LVIYWTGFDRMTYYELNEQLLAEKLDQLYRNAGKSHYELESQTPRNAEKSHYDTRNAGKSHLVMQDSSIIYCDIPTLDRSETTQRLPESVSEQSEKPKQLDELSHALFDLCLVDPEMTTPAVIGSMRKTYKALKAKGTTADQVSGTFADWWYSDSNWTTRKAREKGYKPEPPKPEQILTEWPKAMAGAPKKHARVANATPEQPKPERKARTGAEIRAALERIEAGK
jgi:hypothetical protein